MKSALWKREKDDWRSLAQVCLGEAAIVKRTDVSRTAADSVQQLKWDPKDPVTVTVVLIFQL